MNKTKNKSKRLKKFRKTKKGGWFNGIFSMFTSKPAVTQPTNTMNASKTSNPVMNTTKASNPVPNATKPAMNASKPAMNATKSVTTTNPINSLKSSSS
jgi:hypothetical protein